MTAPPEVHRFIISNTSGIDRVGTLPIDAEWAVGTAISGQWRWNQRRGMWFSHAYAVSWGIGDNVGTPSWTGGISGAAEIQCTPVVGGTPWETYPAGVAVPVGPPNYEISSGLATAATEAGSGVIFIAQVDDINNPSSAVPPPIDPDILSYLGDVVLTDGTNVVEYAVDMGDGDDGDGYIDWPQRNMYERGVANPGIWYLWGNLADNPSRTTASESPDADTPVYRGYGAYGTSGADPISDADLYQLFAGTGIGSYPDPGFRVRPDGTEITMGAEPDDSVLANGQCARWFDPTPGLSAVRFKARDSAGTIVTGTFPLT